MQSATKQRLWVVGLAAAVCGSAWLVLGQQATPSPKRLTAARAEWVRRQTMPDTPGTGRFPALKEEVASLPNHVVYRPADVTRLGPTKLGLYVFGNGGCSNDGASSRMHLLEIASHGYLAIALGRIGSGPGAIHRGERAITDAKELMTAVDWALAQNSDPTSPYHDRIDPTAVAVSGRSCGGLLALHVAGDRRVKTLVIMNSGLIKEGSKMVPRTNLPKRRLNDIHTPTLYVLGGESDRAYEHGMDDFARIDHVPVVAANLLGAGHGGTDWEPNGGKAATAVVAWLNWQLRGDRQAATLFVGKDCGLCIDPAWRVEKKKIE